ncbi:ABC-type dipeptide/oligopeptide/nickel transport system ATPase component [Fontibacillus phaseoli]|uniref:ABC-type dipeptide/oligopeptide/nickel transport system ATPase component n=1 Tax=Fontibacillus phaseoli TaxID=1416533 RepID=A0A369B4E1_9BACL|nr:ABC transporter ATP-binding protein [Fontibacillus phaseoli]RCX15417.1 ABC-type dipeptide/oligopeptide/nickel transport system ATPase component [Fontibacillus phaseoli]
MDVVEIKNLSIRSAEGQLLVHDSSFSLESGKTHCLLGESGSGKTLTSKAILGMLPADLHMSGDILFRGQNLNLLSKKSWRQIRGKHIGTIFQHPEQALHPSIPIGRQFSDLMCSHLPISRYEAEKQAEKMLSRVLLKDTAQVMKSYSHELSGGMNQRVMIAMALLPKPEVVIADEPTSALDVTTQAEIISLLRHLIWDLKMSMLFITHDLLLSSYLADTIGVMRSGEIIEQGSTERILGRPEHEYTKQLCRYRSQRILSKGGNSPNAPSSTAL